MRGPSAMAGEEASSRERGQSPFLLRAHPLRRGVTGGLMMNQSSQDTPDAADSVLIVDDDDSLSRSLQRVLSEEGYVTIRARDGKAALDILQRGGLVPSVILLDLMMPRMGGLELVERLERDDTFCDIPIIFMSGRPALAGGDKVRHRHLLSKPF